MALALLQLGTTCSAAARSQSLASLPVPDVRRAVQHVSSMRTTAPGPRPDTLPCPQHDGELRNMHNHQILKTHPGARADTHTATQMHAQMHMQRHKWDFTLGGTLQHEHNRVFLAGFVLLNSPPFFFPWFIFTAVHISSCKCFPFSVYSEGAAHMGTDSYKKKKEF